MNKSIKQLREELKEFRNGTQQYAQTILPAGTKIHINDVEVKILGMIDDIHNKLTELVVCSVLHPIQKKELLGVKDEPDTRCEQRAEEEKKEGEAKKQEPNK